MRGLFFFFSGTNSSSVIAIREASSASSNHLCSKGCSLPLEDITVGGGKWDSV